MGNYPGRQQGVGQGGWRGVIGPSFKLGRLGCRPVTLLAVPLARRLWSRNHADRSPLRVATAATMC